MHGKRYERAIELGLMDKSAPFPDVDEVVEDWHGLSLKEKIISARGMEIYAGMISNLDYH